MKTNYRDYSTRDFRTIFKQILFVGIIITLMLSFCGCKYLFDNYRSDSDTNNTSEASTVERTDSMGSSASDLTTSSESATSESMISGETSSSDTAASISSESTATTTANRLPDNPSNMYSSYAFMKSFDPATGVASFDYFDMLKGQDAIDFLVNNKGYTSEAAAEEVNNYADSEYVLKNVNPQLRYADMSAVAISMMYDATGVGSTDANTFSLSYAEFLSLFQGHSGDVIDGHFFYFVTVADGQITAVDQVYWP